jgi:hypothetical protein
LNSARVQRLAAEKALPIRRHAGRDMSPVRRASNRARAFCAVPGEHACDVPSGRCECAMSLAARSGHACHKVTCNAHFCSAAAVLVSVQELHCNRAVYACGGQSLSIPPPTTLPLAAGWYCFVGIVFTRAAHMFGYLRRTCQHCSGHNASIYIHNTA